MSLETSPARSAPGPIGFLTLCGFLALAAVSLELPAASAEAPPERSSPSGPLFLRGDSNADGEVGLEDAIYTLSWLFLGGAQPACDDAADTDDDRTLSLSDAVHTLNFVFLGGAVPPPPGVEACGPDPSEDALGCTSYAPCEVSQLDPGGLMGRGASVCEVFPQGTTCPLTCSASAPEVLANGTFDADTCCWCFVVDEESLSRSMTGFIFGPRLGSPCGGSAGMSYADAGGPHTAEAHYEQDFVVSGDLVSATLSFRYSHFRFTTSRNGRSREGTQKLRALIAKVDVDPPEETEVFSVTIDDGSLGGWRSVTLPVLSTIGQLGTYRLKLSLRVEGADNRETGVALDSVSLITEAADSPKNLIGAEVTQASNADVTPGSVDNEVLKVEFTVAGSMGTMNLQSVEVKANNSDTTNDDVTAVKVFFNTTDSFPGIDITPRGIRHTFPSETPAKVLVDVVDTDLPSGSSFMWIVYDIAETATNRDTVDAILEAGSIVTGDDQIWPFCQLDPSGERTIKKTAGGGGRRPR